MSDVSVSIIRVPDIKAASNALSSYGSATSTWEPCVSLYAQQRAVGGAVPGYIQLETSQELLDAC